MFEVGNSAIPVPVFGVHYFGDLQQVLSWLPGFVEVGYSPYAYGVAYPPLAVIVSWPFQAVSIRVAVFALLALFATAMILPAWLLLKTQAVARRIVTVCLAVVLTTPFAATLDRGNFQALVIGCIGFSLVALAWGRGGWASGFAALAISLKFYPVLLMVAPGALKKWRWVGWTVVTAAIVSMGALTVIPGSWTQNISLLTGSLTANTQAQSWHSNYSLAGLVRHVALILASPDVAESARGIVSSYWWVLSLIWLAGLWLIIRTGRIPEWAWGGLVLATLQMAVPVAQAYVTSWATLAAVWFIMGPMLKLRPEDYSDSGRLGQRGYVVLRVAFMVALTATLTPFGMNVGVHGGAISVAPLMSAIAVLVAWIVAVALSTFSRQPAPKVAL